MKILFTGASSFTGFWFVRELSAAGHEVCATFTRPIEAYDGGRGARVAGLAEHCRREAQVSFGDPRFLELVSEGGWDLLCHHASWVTNYKSPEFDAPAALARNAHNLREVLAALAAGGCRRALLTGTFFEAGEGSAPPQAPPVSAYGLSKGLTHETFRFYAAEQGMHLGKFVIPNPFGPHEEPRFTSYLVRNWFAGNTPGVNTPAYLRDNIHVSLLAKAYADFAARLPAEPGCSRLAPQGYRETQGAFTERFAAALRPRLGLPCAVELKVQTEFPEPRERYNADVPDAAALGWDEEAAWDALAAYYQATFGR